MRKVFSNYSEVCHLWAHHSQNEAESGNVRFDEERLFSYGTCIGERFIFSCNLWRIGTDMFGQAILERAKVIRNHVMPYEHYSAELLDRDEAETLYNCLERLKAA